jgi:hypothetical protein
LRRDLEAGGTTVGTLDIGHSGGQATGSGAGSTSSSFSSGGSGGGGGDGRAAPRATQTVAGAAVAPLTSIRSMPVTDGLDLRI